MLYLSRLAISLNLIFSFLQLKVAKDRKKGDKIVNDRSVWTFFNEDVQQHLSCRLYRPLVKFLYWLLRVVWRICFYSICLAFGLRHKTYICGNRRVKQSLQHSIVRHFSAKSKAAQILDILALVKIELPAQRKIHCMRVTRTNGTFLTWKDERYSCSEYQLSWILGGVKKNQGFYKCQGCTFPGLNLC